MPLRLITLVVRDRQMYPSQVGYSAERLVAEQWRAQAEEAQKSALATLPDDVTVEAGVVSGRNWEEAPRLAPLGGRRSARGRLEPARTSKEGLPRLELDEDHS